MRVELRRAETFLYDLDRLRTQAEKDGLYRAYLAELKAERIAVPSALDGGENIEAFVGFIRQCVRELRARMRASLGNIPPGR